jgi:hypothetical protein
MAAGISDYFTKVGSPGNATALAAPGHTIAGTTFNVDSTSLMPTDTAVIFGVDVVTIVNGEEVRTAGTYTVWRGLVTSSTAITSCVLMYGTDQNYSAGTTTRVYILPTSSRENRIVDGLLLDHLNTGRHSVATNYDPSNPTLETQKWVGVSSAVNEVTVTNAATATDPRISASGGDSAVNLNLRGKGLAKTVTIGAGATTIFPYDYVVSGCVWSGDSYGGSLAASMTAGVVVINGNPITVAAVTARAFTTNVDTYIDVLDAGDGTGTVVYTTAATNAASAALAANSIRIGIIQAAATITAATKVNQGQTDRVFPIASSIAYTVTDSLGNLICPRDPQRRILGYRQVIGNTTATTIAQATGLTCPVLVPTGRNLKVTGGGSGIANSTSNATVVLSVWDGVVNAGTQIQDFRKGSSTVAIDEVGPTAIAMVSPSSGLHTYNVGLSSSSGTVTLGASATRPSFIMVELV